MSRYVLDASMAVEWLMASDPESAALSAYERLREHQPIAPHLFRYEIMNVVARLHRDGAITKAELPRLLSDAFSLPEAWADEGWPKDIVELAAAHRLSAYDATYLNAAIFAELPLATCDAALIRAANEVGVPIA